MARYKMLNGERIKLTAEEEKARDAEEKLWNDAAPKKRMVALRSERDLLLQQSDWIVIKEREEGGSVSNFADWKTYRQALRDITKQTPEDDTLSNIKWPTVPK